MKELADLSRVRSGLSWDRTPLAQTPRTIQMATGDHDRRSDNHWAELGETLTEREREVLLILESGATAPAIAAKLQISVGTVKTHLSHIYEKLSVHNRVQAVVLAHRMRHGLTNRSLGD